MSRGHLRIYLGAAPGVGKTYAMLDEGGRRHHAAPTWSSASSRPTGGPEPRRSSATSRSSPRRAIEPTAAPTFEEMDLDAVLARQPAGGPGRRAGPHQRPGLPPRQALAGRRGAARRRHRRHLHGQHPAPRVAQRRGRAHHRRPPARDRARRGGAGRRPGRAGRHDPRGPAAPHGPRQHLRPREGRRRARATTSGSATWRAARAGPALGGRPGRRRPPGLHGGPRHRRHVGDPRAGGRGGHRCARAATTSSGGPPAWPSGPRPTCWGCTSVGRRAGRRVGRGARAPPAAASADLGGTYHEVVGADVARALTQFARAEHATQLVLGATRRGRWAELVRGSVINAVLREADSLDVHVISDDESETEPSGAAGAAPLLERRRRLPHLLGPPPARRVAAHPGRHPVAHARPGPGAGRRSTCRPTCCCTWCSWWWWPWSAASDRRWWPRW